MSKKKPVSFSMDSETHDRFVKIATELNTNKSILVSDLIVRYCNRHDDQDNHYVLLTIPKSEAKEVESLRSWLSKRMSYLLKLLTA